jgi:hypothetical protein
MKPELRPMSALAWAILHRIADEGRDDLERLVAYVSDPENVDHGERWQFLRCAERDAWTAVELLLLRAMIQRRFRDGRLDGWVKTTSLGEEIRDMLAEFFDSHRTVQFPEEPKSFGVIAFQESVPPASQAHSTPSCGMWLPLPGRSWSGLRRD